MPARLAIALVPWAMVWLVAAGVLGPVEAVLATVWSWPQLLIGAVPLPHGGLALLTEASTTVATTSGLPLAALVAAKLVGWNLLPWHGTSGGQVLRALGPSPLTDRVLMALGLVPLVALLGWGLSVLRYATA